MPKPDLRSATPTGRLDVLAYQLGMKYLKGFEEQHGMSGLSETIEPAIHDVIQTGLSGVSAPPELTILLALCSYGLKANATPEPPKELK